MCSQQIILNEKFAYVGSLYMFSFKSVSKCEEDII